jgi:uncharacterized protein YmfQ (DUF2313 family)
MSDTSEKLRKLTQQLYPSGRAWKMPVLGVLDKLHNALYISEEQAYNDAVAIKNSILPDNANFTIDDARQWEVRLGLVSNESLDLETRKGNILRKYNQPGTIKARSNWRYLEKQLRAAGFDVYVYENRFPSGSSYITKTPYELTGDSSFVSALQHGDFQHGDYQHGGLYTKFVANHIDEARDWLFNITNLRQTFYIGGPYAGDFASVPASRKDEFRQLILTIKPVHTIGFLLITYS